MPELVHPGQALYIDDGVVKTAPEHDWVWYYGTSDDILLFGISDTALPALKQWSLEIRNTTKRMPHCHGAAIDEADAKKLKIQDVQVEPFAGRPAKISFKLTGLHNGRSDTQSITIGQENRISATVYEESGELCPLLEYSGYYPTRLVMLLGNTHNGKTCLLNAMQTRNVCERLCRLLPSGEFSRVSPSLEEVFSSTQITEIHHHPFFVDDTGGECKGVVYFIDLSGEISTYERTEHQNDYSIIENTRFSVSSYASALVVVTNLATFLGESEGPVAFLRDLAMANCLPRHICYVQTESDLLREILAPQKTLQLGIASNSEVFDNAADAPDPQEALLRHLAIAHSTLSRRLRGLRIRQNSACFMVSSCCRTHDGQHLDFSQSKNVELPLAWLIRQLINF